MQHTCARFRVIPELRAGDPLPGVRPGFSCSNYLRLDAYIPGAYLPWKPLAQAVEKPPKATAAESAHDPFAPPLSARRPGRVQRVQPAGDPS